MQILKEFVDQCQCFVKNFFSPPYRNETRTTEDDTGVIHTYRDDDSGFFKSQIVRKEKP